MKLWMKILIALVLGTIVGAIIGPKAEYLKPLGTLFLNLINMVIVPLVLASMTVGITNIHDPKKLGRVGLKTLLLYLITTLIAIGLGLALVHLFSPGVGLNLTTSTETNINVQSPPGIVEILLSVIPSNPVQSLAQGNVLQIIVFALFLGVAINFSGAKGRPLLEFMESLADAMYRMTSIVMEFSPIGVFGIMAWVAGTFGLAVLIPLLKFLMVYYLACLIHLVFVYGGLLLKARLNPIPFFRGMGDAIMVAFSTCSSSASLPVVMHCVQQNLGVSKNIAGFILPLGTTINMNGAAIFQAMSVIFVAQAYGMDLGMSQILTIVVTATLATLGAAGVPGSGFIMLSVVFTSVGVPLEGLALLAGIDRVREMVSTVLNVLGDAVCTVYVAKQEGELDERQYNHEELVEMEGSDV